MARNKLETVSDGEILTISKVDAFRQAMIRENIPRGSNGAPAMGQDLGSILYQFDEIHAKSVYINRIQIDDTFYFQTNNSIISGKVRGSQPSYLIPAGSGNGPSLQILGASTNLKYRVGTELITLSSDITESALTLALTANNSCTIDESDLQNESIGSRTYGEGNQIGTEKITVSAMGSEISSLIGKFAGFQVVNSSTGQKEYFVAFIKSTTELTNVRRGFFIDENANPIPRIKLRNGNTITMLSLGWVFLENDSHGVFLSYTNPFYGYTAPDSPTTNDYWFDFYSDVWKRYNGSSFIETSRLLIGLAIINSTDCVGTRPFEFFCEYEKIQSCEILFDSTTELGFRSFFSNTNVSGKKFDFNFSTPLIDSTFLASDPDTYDSALVDLDWWWYIYLTSSGEFKFSSMEPQFSNFRRGYFHPFQNWRCLGRVFTDSGDFTDLKQTFDEEIHRRFPLKYVGVGVDSITPLDTFVALTFGTENFENYSFLKFISTSQFYFLFSGIYEIFLDMEAKGINDASTSETSMKHELHLYNVSGSSSQLISRYNGIKIPATYTEHKSVPIHGFFQINDCSNIFSLMSKITFSGGGTDIRSQVTNKYLHINYLGKR